MEQIQKRGVGRPKNSVSYIGIKLSDLNKMLAPEAIILVDSGYRIVAKMNNVEVSQVRKEDLQDLRMGGKNDNVLEFSITDFSGKAALA